MTETPQVSNIKNIFLLAKKRGSLELTTSTT
jgi:hypothetical protein